MRRKRRERAALPSPGDARRRPVHEPCRHGRQHGRHHARRPM